MEDGDVYLWLVYMTHTGPDDPSLLPHRHTHTHTQSRSMSTHTLGHTRLCIVHTQVKSLTDPEALIHQNLQGIISQP